MCNPASFIASRHKVWWHPTSDSHEDILSHFGIHIDGVRGVNAVPVEISPSDWDLSRPLDEWFFRTDIGGYMRELPEWWNAEREIQRCRAALADWAEARLSGWRVYEAFHPHNPFESKPKPMSQEEIVSLVTQWASVGDSVWASVGDSVWASVGASVWGSFGASVGSSVWNSVWASVGNSVGDSVGNSVRDSVGDSVWASVGDSVWASVGSSVRDSVWASIGASVGGYIGSLFPSITTWAYTDNPHPWDALRELWLSGRVPSFDGTTWRIHVGPDASVEMEFVLPNE